MSDVLRVEFSFVCSLLLSCFLLAAKAAPEELGEGKSDQPSTRRTDIRLTVSVATNRVTTLSPIMLQAVLENNTTNSLYVSEIHKLADCEVFVWDKQGEAVPRTRFAKKLARTLQNLGEHALMIAPGGHHTYEIPVNLLYDMSIPGQYTIKARISVSLGDRTPKPTLEIESLPLDVTVQRMDSYSSPGARERERLV